MQVSIPFHAKYANLSFPTLQHVQELIWYFLSRQSQVESKNEYDPTINMRRNNGIGIKPESQSKEKSNRLQSVQGTMWSGQPHDSLQSWRWCKSPRPIALSYVVVSPAALLLAWEIAHGLHDLFFLWSWLQQASETGNKRSLSKAEMFASRLTLAGGQKGHQKIEHQYHVKEHDYRSVAMLQLLYIFTRL
jgi:hypothetical protein